MRETIQNALPYLPGSLFGLALLLILVSLHLFRRSRTDIFWRRRREAGQRGWKLFVLAFGLIVFGSVSCVLTLVVGVLGDDDSSAANTPLTTQETALSVDTPGALDSAPPPTPETNSAPETTPDPFALTPPPATLMIVIITATPAYTPTVTPFPTFTPQVTPAVSSVTPRPDAALRIAALSDQIDAALRPVNPRTTFAAGTKRIFFFVEFSAMTEGVLWRRTIYKDGELFDDNTYVWGLAASGTGHFFFGQDSGFEPGDYEIRLYIGEADTPASVMPFTVVPET